MDGRLSRWIGRWVWVLEQGVDKYPTARTQARRMHAKIRCFFVFRSLVVIKYGAAYLSMQIREPVL